jgi:ATP-dependent protease ClpP protease subunit
VELPHEIQHLFQNGIDFYDKRIYLTGYISEDVAAEVIKSLYLFARVPEPVELFIQSCGGDLCATFAIYDTIQSLSSEDFPIHCVASGEVCSAALLLLSCGFTRSATPNVYAMAHTASAEVPEGETHTVLSSATATDDMNKRMWALLAKHTNLSAKEWSEEAKEGGEIWMSAKELKKRGIIDDIIPALKTRRRVKGVATVKKGEGSKAPKSRKK